MEKEEGNIIYTYKATMVSSFDLSGCPHGSSDSSNVVFALSHAQKLLQVHVVTRHGEREQLTKHGSTLKEGGHKKEGGPCADAERRVAGVPAGSGSGCDTSIKTLRILPSLKGCKSMIRNLPSCDRRNLTELCQLR